MLLNRCHNFPKATKPVVVHICDRKSVENKRLERFEVQNPYKSLPKVDFSNESETNISFSYDKSSLQLNHYLKNDFDENPRRFFIAGLFQERGGQQDDRGKL